MRLNRILLILLVSITSLSSSCAEPIGDPVFHLANQNTFPELISNGKHIDSGRVLLDTFFIGGYALKAGRNETVDSFLNTSYPTMLHNFQRYLQTNGDKLTRDFQGSLILDIEHPVHLIKLFKLPKEKVVPYIKAINTRVSMVRSIFPKAKLGLYGLFVPHQSCKKMHLADQNRLGSFRTGISNGIMKGVDFFTTVAYLRWDPNDRKWRNKNLDINRCIAEKISYVDEIAKKNNLQYRPLLSLRIYNKRSAYHHKFVNYKDPNDKLFLSLLAQAKVFKARGVKDIIIWNADDATKPSNQNDWSQLEAVKQLDLRLTSDQ